MKANRLLVLIIIFTLLGAATVFADTVYEKYIAKKVTVKVNGTELESHGLVVDINKDETKTMVPLHDLVSSIGGIVSVDNNEINIYKPNVQLSTLLAKDKRPFGIVQKGKYEILVFAQVDSLYTKISSLKITVVDPFGTEVESNVEAIVEKDQQKENFYYMSKSLGINFKYTGKYTVNLYMKESGGSSYAKVAQIGINSVSE
jgi:hypothetical protein